MHRFLTVFLCLSTLAMTQNVVAGTPSPSVSLEARLIEAGGRSTALAGPDQPRGAVGGEIPSPTSMMMLVTGLAGLSAVGSRGRATNKQPVRP